MLLALLALAGAPRSGQAAQADRFVVQISIDGLGSSWLEPPVAAGELPAFARFQREGAWTNNARTDFDFTITLPNHTCMITGRPVCDRVIGQEPFSGHLWVINTDLQPGNLHENHHGYLPSTFDVVHDHGLRTGLFVTKSKFKLYDLSYGGWGGAPDTVAPNNGRNKIDVYENHDKESPLTIQRFLDVMRTAPVNYAFVHIHDTDSAGHLKGWGGKEYNEALRGIDGYLAMIFELLTTNAVLKDRTTIILSADHGGQGRNHADKANPADYTIPFYVWGAGVGQGRDLYELNRSSRRDPGNSRPDYSDPQQPIRNGDGGNLALSLLGLPPIPGSLINLRQDLVVEERPVN